jgi:hypothetical protein
VTSHEQETAQSADRDIPDTAVIVVPAPSPVFVDSTGRRRRLLRRLSYAFGAVCVLYGGLISVSLAGGPVSSSAILPLPDLGGAAAEAHPTPTPRPTLASPKARAIIEALPRRDLPVAGNERLVVTRPATTPAAPRATSKPATPKPSATTSKPVESTATPTPSVSPSASASPTPSTSPSTGPTRQPPPVPPNPPSTGADGGSGGATSGGTGGSASGGTGSTSGGSEGSGPATAMPAPSTGAPTTDTADATPVPTPQPPAGTEVPA